MQSMFSQFFFNVEEAQKTLYAPEPHKLIKTDNSSTKLLKGDDQMRSRNFLTPKPSESSSKYSKWNEIRKNFYDLYRILEARPSLSESFRKELQKEISSKSFTLFSVEELLFHFERIIRKKMSMLSLSSNKKWNQQEVQFLISLVAYYSSLHALDRRNLSQQHWETLASVFPKQVSKDELKLKWLSLLKTNLATHPWRQEEDELLAAIVTSLEGRLDWKKITQEYNQKIKTGVFRQIKQCRERWDNHLNQNMNKGFWTEEEDIRLINCLIKHGKKWAEISKIVGDRTENSVRNRWISLEKRFKTLKTSIRSEGEEDTDESKFERAILVELEKARNMDTVSSVTGASQKGTQAIIKESALKLNKLPKNLRIRSPKRTEGEDFNSKLLAGNLSLKESKKHFGNLEGSFDWVNYHLGNHMLPQIANSRHGAAETNDGLVRSSFGDEMELSPSVLPENGEMLFWDFNDFNHWDISKQQAAAQKANLPTTKAGSAYKNTNFTDSAANSYPSQPLSAIDSRNLHNSTQKDLPQELYSNPQGFCENVQLQNSSKYQPKCDSIALQNFKCKITTNILSFNETKNRLSAQNADNLFAFVDFARNKIQMLDKETFLCLQSLFGVSVENFDTQPSYPSHNSQDASSFIQGRFAGEYDNNKPLLKPKNDLPAYNYYENQTFHRFTETQFQAPTYHQSIPSQCQSKLLQHELSSQGIFEQRYYSGSV